MPQKAVEVFIENLLRQGKIPQQAKSKDGGLFTSLTEDNLQALLSHSYMQDFQAGQEIVQHGDIPEHLYYIIQGGIKTSRFSEEGGEATIRLLKPGETFMDAVIFMGGPSPISVQALEASKLLLIPAGTVRHQALHDPQFATNLLKIVTSHYKSALQQIESITIKDPVARLGYYLLKLHIENGSSSLDIALPFQKSVIASYLGMKPETFSRALSRIKAMGIDVDRDKLTMRDAYALCHFCDPDTASSCPKYETDECPLCTQDFSRWKCLTAKDKPL